MTTVTAANTWMPSITAGSEQLNLYTLPPMSSFWSNGLQLAAQTQTIPFNLVGDQVTYWTGAGTNGTGNWEPYHYIGTSAVEDARLWQIWPTTIAPPIPKEAEIQAKELLKEFIGEEGVRTLENGGVVRIGGMYEVDHLGCCWKLLPDGSKKRFCLIPDESLPWGDTLVNKIIPLICEPEHCEKVANWFN